METKIEDLEIFIEDLKQLKEGLIDISSPEGQTLLSATIITFELLRQEYEAYIESRRRQ